MRQRPAVGGLCHRACKFFCPAFCTGYLASGLGDTRSLVTPVAPTIFWEMGLEMRKKMGIAEGLIRFSVGLEDTADLLADFEQVLKG